MTNFYSRVTCSIYPFIPITAGLRLRLVFMIRLARQIDAKNPTMDAIIQRTPALMNRDYAGEALRTPETLAIDGLSASQLRLL